MAGGELMPFLVAAFDWRDAGEWDAARILAAPEVAHYAAGWPRPGDQGIVAQADGVPVGAAWWRTFAAADASYGFVAEDVPEIGLAVLPSARGRGVGALLLDALIGEARAGDVPGLSLSVEDGNDAARRIYERAGFSASGRSGNSDTLVLWLNRRPAT